MEVIRQGDVMMVRVEDIPQGVGKSVDKYVLAEGEVTGHAHVLWGRATMFLADEGRGTYLQVHAPSMLKHEEHREIPVPPGKYAVVRQVEADILEGVRQVAD
jgi:hypothetical protein